MEKTHPLYPFSLSHRNIRLQVRQCQLLGWMAVAFNISLLTVRPASAVPFMALGVAALSLSLLLWAVFRLCRSPERRGFLGRWIYAHRDRGFAIGLFALQTVFILITAITIWISLPALGLDVLIWQHTLFYLMVLLIPVKRMLRKYTLLQPSADRLHRFHDVLAYLLFAAGAVLLTGSVHRTIAPTDRAFKHNDIVFMTLLWVPAVLAVIVCLSQILARITRSASPSIRQWQRQMR